MTSPNAVYYNLLDRADYLLRKQEKAVNDYWKRANASGDSEYTKICMERMNQELDRLEAMTELFEAVFQDYKCGVVVYPELSEYRYEIEPK